MNEPTLVPCPDCGATGVAECPETGEDYPCPLCGGGKLITDGGDEMRIRDMEVV